MKKIVCDICGRDAGNQSILLEPIRDYNFSISMFGNRLDICDDCRKSFLEWKKSRELIKEGIIE